jgi:hypothetical protein
MGLSTELTHLVSNLYKEGKKVFVSQLKPRQSLNVQSLSTWFHLYGKNIDFFLSKHIMHLLTNE